MKTKKSAKIIQISDRYAGDASGQTGVAAVERALAILMSFRSGDEALSLAELASRTGLYKSTILRLLVSLQRNGFVSRSESGRYMPGIALVRLGGLAEKSLDLRSQIEPTLRGLAETVKESASLYVRQGDQRLCMYRVDAPRSVRDHIQVGDLLPLHVGAAGHVLMRFDGSNEEPPRTKDPLIVTYGERDPDVAALAGPVFANGSSLVGALAISGPIGRFTATSVVAMRYELREACIKLTLSFNGSIAAFEGTVRRKGSKRTDSLADPTQRLIDLISGDDKRRQ